MANGTDWIKIRNEYINGNISYRKLAEKHGVSFNTLQIRARDEKWYEKRKNQHDKITEKLRQKTADKLAEKEANRLMRISNAADKLLAKIEEATEQLDQFIVINKVRQKEIEYEHDKAGYGKVKKETVKEGENKRVVKANHLDRTGLLQLTGALRNLQGIQFTNSEDKPQEAPSINITIQAATPDDMEGEED